MAKNSSITDILKATPHKTEPKNYFDQIINKRKLYFKRIEDLAERDAIKDFNNNLIKKFTYGNADPVEGKYDLEKRKFYYYYHFNFIDDKNSHYMEAYNKQIEMLMKK